MLDYQRVSTGWDENKDLCARDDMVGRAICLLTKCCTKTKQTLDTKGLVGLFDFQDFRNNELRILRMLLTIA